MNFPPEHILVMRQPSIAFPWWGFGPVSDLLLSWALVSIRSTSVLSSFFLADAVVKESLIVVVYCVHACSFFGAVLRVFGYL